MEQGIMQDHKPERWITQIQNGVVTLVQQIAADALVVSASDLPAVAANTDFVSDRVACEIVRAIRKRD